MPALTRLALISTTGLTARTLDALRSCATLRELDVSNTSDLTESLDAFREARPDVVVTGWNDVMAQAALGDLHPTSLGRVEDDP